MSVIKRYIIRTFFFFALLAIAQVAFCWGVTGHRVVAEIAQQHLSKKAKREISKLIGRESLAWWANWGDFIKSDSTWKHADSWHYINLPGNLSREQFMDNINKQTGKNLYTQIKAMAEQVKNSSLSIEQRREALYLLIHFYGDLHQPLHIGHADDQGGNKIVVYWFDKKTNLHSVWDSQLIDFQQYSYSEYARLLDIATKEKVAGWQAATLEDILFETYSLANVVYASVTPEENLGYKYNYTFQSTINDQLLKGGVRLAAMLNQMFK